MTRSNVKAMLNKVKEKDYVFVIDLDLMPPYPTGIQ